MREVKEEEERYDYKDAVLYIRKVVSEKGPLGSSQRREPQDKEDPEYFQVKQGLKSQRFHSHVFCSFKIR